MLGHKYHVNVIYSLRGRHTHTHRHHRQKQFQGTRRTPPFSWRAPGLKIHVFKEGKQKPVTTKYGIIWENGHIWSPHVNGTPLVPF